MVLPSSHGVHRDATHKDPNLGAGIKERVDLAFEGGTSNPESRAGTQFQVWLLLWRAKKGRQKTEKALFRLFVCVRVFVRLVVVWCETMTRLEETQDVT